MKSKILVSVLIIGLVALLIGGNTMAWFTDEEGTEDVTYTAGTLNINVDETSVYLGDDRPIDKINPGDCSTIVFDVNNVGTKRAYIKAEMVASWTNDLGIDDLGIDNVKILPAPNSGWKRAADGPNGELRFYYWGENGENGIVPGTYGDQENTPVPVPLKLVVVFDPEATDNDYQGQAFTLSNITFNAIQVTNGALESVWGPEWAEIFSPDYDPGDEINALYNEYFAEGGYGASTQCWRYHLGEPEEPIQYGLTALVGVYQDDNFVENNECGTIEGPAGPFNKGDEVTLTASPGTGYQFVSWDFEGLNFEGDATSNSITFTMPANPVTVKAIFEKEVVVQYTLKAEAWRTYKNVFNQRITEKSTDWGTVSPTSVKNYPGTSVTLTAQPASFGGGKASIARWDKSTDGGETWDFVQDSPNQTTLTVEIPDNDDTIYRVVFKR